MFNIIQKDDGSLIIQNTSSAAEALKIDSSNNVTILSSATLTATTLVNTTLTTANVDAGASGIAGSVDVFPTTAAKGKVAITATDNTGDTTTSIVVGAQGGARTYTIPDADGSANFAMENITEATLTSAQILALNATPISVISAPGAGFANIIKRVYATKAAGTAYAGIAAGEDIAFKYTNSSGDIAAQLEMTGFADSASATQSLAVGIDCLPVANAAIVAHMLSGEITTGDSDFKLRIEYETVAIPAF